MSDDAGAEFDRLFSSSAVIEEECLFSRDCLWVRDHVMASPDRLLRVAAFVVMSIRQPFMSIETRMVDYDRHGLGSKFLHSWKPDCLRYVHQHRRDIHRTLARCLAGQDSPEETLYLLTRIHGLGPAKAAFFGQLCTGRFACLDSLNLRALGWEERSFRMDKNRPGCHRRILANYLAACNANGTPAHWWNVWCQRLAERRVDIRGYNTLQAASADVVSRLHRLAVLDH